MLEELLLEAELLDASLLANAALPAKSTAIERTIMFFIVISLTIR